MLLSYQKGKKYERFPSNIWANIMCLFLFFVYIFSSLGHNVSQVFLSHRKTIKNSQVFSSWLSKKAPKSLNFLVNPLKYFTSFFNWASFWKYLRDNVSQIQASSRVYWKHARAFMRTLAKPGEVWRTLANPERHIHENLPDIHQTSGEGPSHSPEFRWRCLLYVGGLQNLPNKCFQSSKISQNSISSKTSQSFQLLTGGSSCVLVYISCCWFGQL